MHIPVIFLTGSGNTAAEVKCLESGAMDYITKPANTDILRHRIDLHLQFSSYQLRLEHMIKELEDNIGVSFAELLACKDYNIAGHLLRTGEYVELLTKELMKTGTFGDETTAEYPDTIKRAIPFHDIGKLGISDIILLKRSALTEDEFREIQRHTLIGGQVLQAIYNRSPNQHYLKMAITIAEGHHERYNGMGYPRGLKGDEIPLCCRIMSVANVYDTCVTDRIYRKRLSHEESRDYILAGRGTEFDPRIVDAFEKAQDVFAQLTMTNSLLPEEREWYFQYETNTGY
jgi:putative two-component system response regulator